MIIEGREYFIALKHYEKYKKSLIELSATEDEDMIVFLAEQLKKDPDIMKDISDEKNKINDTDDDFIMKIAEALIYIFINNSLHKHNKSSVEQDWYIAYLKYLHQYSNPDVAKTATLTDIKNFCKVNEFEALVILYKALEGRGISNGR